MRCLNCNKELEPSGKDHLTISDDRVIVRFIDCQFCGHVNTLNYYFSEVTSSYDAKLDSEELKSKGFKTMLNEKVKKDIEKMGGRLLGKPNGLISNFTFKSVGVVQNSYWKLIKKYPGVDFFARGRRLLVYGITD